MVSKVQQDNTVNPEGHKNGFLLPAVIVFLAVLGGFLANSQKPKITKTDPVSTITKAPSSLIGLNSSRQGEKSATISQQKPHNNIHSSVTSWSDVKKQREDAWEKWRIAEEKRRQRLIEERRKAAEAYREKLAIEEVRRQRAAEAYREKQAVEEARRRRAAEEASSVTAPATPAPSTQPVPVEVPPPVEPTPPPAQAEQPAPASQPEETPAVQETPPTEPVQPEEITTP